jgi:hypothetical protein
MELATEFLVDGVEDLVHLLVALPGLLQVQAKEEQDQNKCNRKCTE